MSSGFPNYRPVPQYVVDNLNLKKKAVYTSRLNAWIRVIGNSGNGLVLQSNPNLPIFGSQSVYGNSEKPGAIGLDWEGNVVTVQEEDRGYRPSPIIEGLNLKRSHNIDGFSSVAVPNYSNPSCTCPQEGVGKSQ